MRRYWSGRANVIIPIEYLLVKMEATLGLGLQAIGIILEGIGLILAFRSFGTVKDRWLSDTRKNNYALIESVRREYEKEKRKLSYQLLIIGLGLTLQLLGLFIS